MTETVNFEQLVQKQLEERAQMDLVCCEMNTLFKKHTAAVEALQKDEKNIPEKKLKILNVTSWDLFSQFCLLRDIINIKIGNFKI